ncbi:MAG: OsmC family protein [Candidatus Cloacimonetes bacterium]|jgi:putative redox protein|nr:OsmC family protein [Candidatus Cloacimonadota bacterium]MBT6994174.1 OsmC family protein [Candidatus Cloacimonadota bacterium]MBT7469737.1 OsmC family protein [Candidatus Cloacimonadota bacterium]
MSHKSTTVWKNDGLKFESTVNGHKVVMDTAAGDSGARPKILLLSALAGCTGMDVVSILSKMKVENFELTIDADAEQTDEHPKVYHTIDVTYNFVGESLPIDKIKRAIELSQTRYCGVSKMLGETAKINTKIKINSEEI